MLDRWLGSGVDLVALSSLIALAMLALLLTVVSADRCGPPDPRLVETALGSLLAAGHDPATAPAAAVQAARATNQRINGCPDV